MKRYPYTFFAVLLIIILVVPFVLLLKDPRLEVYPSIIFPTYSETIQKKDNSIQVIIPEIHSAGAISKQIDIQEFMGELPINHFYTLVEGDFGLNPYSNKIKLYKPPVTLQKRNHITEASLKETRDWIKNKLREQGAKDSSFVLTYFKITFDPQLSETLSKELVSEEVFKLY